MKKRILWASRKKKNQVTSKGKKFNYHQTFNSNHLCQEKKWCVSYKNTPRKKIEAKILYLAKVMVKYKGCTWHVANRQELREILFLWALSEESVRERISNNQNNQRGISNRADSIRYIFTCSVKTKWQLSGRENSI